MRSTLPMIIALLIGIFAFLEFFIPHRTFSDVAQRITDWIPVVASIALILGAISLFNHHIQRIFKKHPDKWFSISTLAAMVITVAFGLIWGIEDGTPFSAVYNMVYKPMTNAMFSLLAFFLASAAFRSFRIRSVEAGLLFAAALIVMLGRIPIGSALWADLPLLADWIMDIPTTSAMRAIRIGVGLGMATLSVKIILGLEKTYMG
jgi:hypothetical protein